MHRSHSTKLNNLDLVFVVSLKPARFSKTEVRKELFQGIFKHAVKPCSNIHERDALELQLRSGSEKTEAKHTSEFQLANRLAASLPVLICYTTALANQTSFTDETT